MMANFWKWVLGNNKVMIAKNFFLRKEIKEVPPETLLFLINLINAAEDKDENILKFDCECSIGNLAELTDIAQVNLRSHLSILQELDIINIFYGAELEVEDRQGLSDFDRYKLHLEKSKDRMRKYRQSGNFVTKVFISVFGRKPTSYEKEDTDSLVDKYGEQEVNTAFRIAAKQNKKSLAYIEGILKNNKTENYELAK